MTAAETTDAEVKTLNEMHRLFLTWRAEVSDAALDSFLFMSPEWDAEQAAKIVEYVRKNAPKLDYGKDNSNTGRVPVRFSVGREGSSVLYAAFVKTGTGKTAVEWETFARMVIRFARQKAKADEADIVEKSDLSMTLRFWWD